MRVAWIDSHTQACEATRVYGEQSEELLDRRMSCLAQRRGELAAVSAALVAAEPETVKGVDKLVATRQGLNGLQGGKATTQPGETWSRHRGDSAPCMFRGALGAVVLKGRTVPSLRKGS